jgi:dipeptidyl aminopeptidase/acylaminoacyl peptidase
MKKLIRFPATFIVLSIGATSSISLHAAGFLSSDMSRLRAVDAVAFSPDGRRIAYTITMFDRPGRPYPQLWVMDVAGGKSIRIGGEKDPGSSPEWSPDGSWIAFEGEQGGKGGLLIAHPDGSSLSMLTSTSDTNSPLPGQGDSLCWSPDSKMVAYVSSTPGP